MPVYPLLLEPILKPKVWGGRRLEQLNKHLPDGQRIGESWELADLDDTDPQGGGGGAARSRIAGGEMRGLTIAEVITALGPNLMGTLRSIGEESGFPLLLKFLDARENLSVQVHPDPPYAEKHPGAKLKTESWYVIDADPGAVIYKGIREGVTPEAFEAHIKDASVVDDLIAVPAQAGDFHHLPSGTCHALGAGVMVAEVQTPSDTTFRVFDWGRTGRALHVEQALECVACCPPDRTEPIRSTGGPRTVLVDTPFYSMIELALPGNTEHAIENVPSPPAGAPMVWMVIAGQGRLRSDEGAFELVDVRAGDTVLFPAALDPTTFDVARDATVLEIRLPITEV